MQVFNSAVEVTVNSANHGQRTFLVAETSCCRVLEVIQVLIEPWLDDPDIELAVSKAGVYLVFVKE